MPRMPSTREGNLGVMQAVEKRPLNLSVNVEMLAAAREARVNLSALLEQALVGELARLRRRRWREENARAVSAYNEYLASHGTCFEARLDE
jgi:antitoxin CcdA